MMICACYCLHPGLPQCVGMSIMISLFSKYKHLVPLEIRDSTEILELDYHSMNIHRILIGVF
jgi:hypothetical protein